MRCAFDETVRKIEFAAEFDFAGCHFALVGLVVFAGQVEEAVEDEDLYFGFERVVVSGGLAGCGVERNGEVAGVLCGYFGWCGEAEDVGGFVLATIGAVEALELGVGGEEDVYLAFEAHG
jgi:hypothetical protein